ncbi:hypothetical protein LTR91_021148 [Friedmanniomyces endolithicus]|uniref:proline--tRNA ligase n=1 Tax=Friedmanniomyces endolithicus TaxID=329885 RepID=A0AAN6H7J0_9PEZI|nr:hypothetical protein LTR57_024557 [Friedmanniomyces endolithicus]KAK0958835.1 hypothetical protein LTR91_021148 [Friedmanniomyces endolithicus]KAK0959931.1 hypothetical protein LTS01_021149 [Friedmanniomyces endolithicus]KAK1039819.1 hypothetical protein LTS16_010935 [Friedmanniomyces endolithicus]
MLYHNGLKQGLQAFRRWHITASTFTSRSIHHDGRNRLSNFWTPSQSKKVAETGNEDAHDLLVRAGFLRQAHSGIFHLLPLGLRVQEKIERLVDKHMLALGASKVSLSSLTSESLWQRSGRLEKGRGSEFFRLEDRKGTKMLLAPTHEEEITTIVANAVHSHKQLPLRLYQVSRKYRDEARPRQGLLRGHSGNMGGNLSHEYHFASEDGEDTVIKCSQCEYSINEELYTGGQASAGSGGYEWTFMISKDRRTLLAIAYPVGRQVNTYAVKRAISDVDASVEAPLEVWKAPESEGLVGRTIRWLGESPRDTSEVERISKLSHALRKVGISAESFSLDISDSIFDDRLPSGFTRAQDGDECPSCRTGQLTLHKAVEIGHTFHLGTRYSDPLGLRVTDANNTQSLVHMGCHGIGVSRLIGAAASLLADDKGLNWPIAIAPYSAIIITARKASTEDVQSVYDGLQQSSEMDVIIDDRAGHPTGWKLHDADLIGYPFIVVLGKAWAERRAVELQCRRLGVKEEVRSEDLAQRIAEMRGRL